jgi:hypothetical protein
MTIQEAMKVIKPQGNDKEALQSAWRLLAKKYHPDINPDGLELMKCVNAAYSFLTENIGKWSLRSFCDDGTPSIDEELAAIYAKLRHLAGIKLEVCGSWLWVTGDTKPVKDFLKEAGLRFSPNKSAWYWHPAGYRKRSKQKFSMDEVRNMWGSQDLKPEEAKGVNA